MLDEITVLYTVQVLLSALSLHLFLVLNIRGSLSDCRHRKHHPRMWIILNQLSIPEAYMARGSP